MSHVATVAVKVTDVAAFREAVESLGGTFNAEARSYRWYGHFVGDSPMPAGMTVADLGKCDAGAASFPGCAYDVGLRSNADGTYTLAYDYWGTGGLAQKLGGNTLPKLVQEYAAAKMQNEARRLGHAIESREVLADGTIRLRLLAAR